MIGYLEITCLIIISCATSSWTQEDPSRDSEDGKGGKSKCWLTAADDYRHELTQRLAERAKMIEVTISLEGHPSDMLDQMLNEVFNPYLWIRTTNRQGRSLLMLDDNYRYKSMSTLSIGVAKMEVNVTDQPVRCIRGLGQEEILTVIRESFLRDFNVPGPNSSHEDNTGSFDQEDHICNMQILKTGDYAEFRYRCCQIGFDGSMSCHDLEQDDWVKFLLVLVIIIKILVVLYSPLFLPDSLYRMKYVAGEYIYHKPAEPLTLKVAVTQNPDQFGDNGRNKTVRLSKLKHMKYFKAMVSNSSWVPDKIYEIHVQDVRLSVKTRRLLDSNSVPVTAMNLLYKNFLRCQIGRLEPLKECCNSDILGRLSPGFKIATWRKVMRIVAQICLLALLATPWVIQTILYIKYEAPLIEKKTQAANVVGLKVKLPPSAALHMTPLHGLFIVVYIIFVIDSIVYGAVSGGVKEKFKYVTRQCLRDMRERSRYAVLGWTTKLLVMPFKVCGIVGLVFFVPYLVLLSIITLPVIAFYMCPTLNLSIRLLVNLFVFTCPRRAAGKLEEWFQKLTPVKKYLLMQEVTANETIIRKHHYTSRGIILQLIIIIMCLVSFWSVTLLLMEIISFFVEMFVYTFMGIVVNAGVTLQYVTVLLLVFMYCKNVFSRVYWLYLNYHRVIHRQLMSMSKEEVVQVAAREAIDQENTAFVVQGEVEANKPQSFSPKIRIKNHKPMWLTVGMLVFLDTSDTPLTPEKFFHETIGLNYYGCPGPVYRNVRRAIWEFLKIVLFLLFVFVVVMALGDAYQISTTNQVLATVVGGFLPFIFRHFFTSSAAVDHIDTSSIQFKSEFHKAINGFTQSWSVYDIIPVSVRDSLIAKKPLKKIVPTDRLTNLLHGSDSENSQDEDGEDVSANGDDDDDVDGVHGDAAKVGTGDNVGDSYAGGVKVGDVKILDEVRGSGGNDKVPGGGVIVVGGVIVAGGVQLGRSNFVDVTLSSGANAGDGVPADGVKTADGAQGSDINLDDGTQGNKTLAGTQSSLSLDANLADVDIIVDVSNSETQNLSTSDNKDLEKGSVSMLDRGHRNSANRRTYSSSFDSVS